MPDWEVYLTSDAEKDLGDLLLFIDMRDSPERADSVFERLKRSILDLVNFPHRGRIVPELKEMGVLEYREIFFKPYRIMYFTRERKVYIVAIFDGRRDLEEVLHRRFLP